ncbi:MAG: rod shape-determining protein MreC [Gammaproteobacteria bacterium]|nr:rod shape-determining protein MreC [Gammaproteobacteria bacterium]
MLLTQIFLLKAYYINISSLMHWTFVEKVMVASDYLKLNIKSVSNNKKIFSDLEAKEKIINELKSKLLISEANNLTKEQLNTINLNKIEKDHWILAKSRYCTNDSLYAQVDEKTFLKKGSIVIHSRGVIGLVANDCNDNYCLVKFINHKDTSIALNNKNDQVSGLMTVNKNSNLTLNYVNQKNNLIQNETLYTAGFLSEQPAGFPVAFVSEKFIDLKGQFHYYLTAVEGLNCPVWTMIWKS